MNFMRQWPFWSIVDGSRPDVDRFVSFFPFGSTPGGFSVNENNDFLGIVPARGWNYNWTSIDYQGVDDGKFVTEMIASIETKMAERLTEVGISYTGSPLDVSRRFLFGYSAGGAMAFHLANRATTNYAALWIQSGAYGGRRHMRSNLGSTVTNPPRPPLGGTSFANSLFLHTGRQDSNVNPNGTATAGPNLSASSRNVYSAGGLNPPHNGHYARGDLPALAAIDAYRAHNGTNVQTTLSNQPNRNGGNTAVRTQWRRSAGVNNPIVEHYDDPTMDHTNYFSGNRYFDVNDVWAWFKAHPRVV